MAKCVGGEKHNSAAHLSAGIVAALTEASPRANNVGNIAKNPKKSMETQKG